MSKYGNGKSYQLKTINRQIAEDAKLIALRIRECSEATQVKLCADKIAEKTVIIAKQYMIKE